MVGWIQGENGNLDTKISEEKESAKISNFRTLSSNFALWFEVCENVAQWAEDFAPWFPSCENFAQPDAVVFRRPYLSHFSSKSYMVWTVGVLTFWALKWYIECKKWTSESAPKVRWKTAAVSPVFIPCFLLLHCFSLVNFERLRQRIMRLHSLISS